jgi:hypothetical protein
MSDEADEQKPVRIKKEPAPGSCNPTCRRSAGRQGRNDAPVARRVRRCSPGRAPRPSVATSSSGGSASRT